MLHVFTFLLVFDGEDSAEDDEAADETRGDVVHRALRLAGTAEHPLLVERVHHAVPAVKSLNRTKHARTPHHSKRSFHFHSETKCGR